MECGNVSGEEAFVIGDCCRVYTARVAATSQGRTRDEALVNVREAINLHVEVLRALEQITGANPEMTDCSPRYTSNLRLLIVVYGRTFFIRQEIGINSRKELSAIEHFGRADLSWNSKGY